MSRGVILNLIKLKLFEYLTLNKILILLCALFIAGIAVGSAVFSKNNSLAEFSKNMFESYISTHQNKHWFYVLISSFAKYMFVLLLYFLSGTSMLGVAVVPVVTFWQGVIAGSVSSYLYSCYSLKGVAFNAVILVPPSIIFTICCFFAAKESIGFSLFMAKLTLPKSKPASMYNDFRKYCGKFIIFAVALIFTAIADLVLNLLFLHFFDF